MKKFIPLFFALGATLLFSACASTVRPPAPQQGMLEAPRREASRIAIPVVIDLDTLAADLERRIDASFSKESRKDGLLQWSLALVRIGKVQLLTEGNSLRVQLPLSLKAEAGGGGKFSMLKAPPIDFGLPISFSVPMDFGGDGSLLLKVPELAMPQVPEIFQGSKLLGGLASAGSAGLQALVQKSVLDPLQQKLSKTWSDLQAPVALGDMGWLVLQPDSLLFRGVRAIDAKHIELGLGIVTQVRVATEKPVVAPVAMVPLVKTSGLAPGIRLQLPVQASFASLQAMAQKQLVGKKFGSEKRWLQVDGVELAGQQVQAADGSMANGIRVSLKFQAETGSWFFGKREGVLHLTTFPTLDTTTQVLSLAGASLTSDTRSALVDKGLEWALELGYDKILSEAKVDLGQQLQKPLAALQSKLDAGLPAGPLKIHGKVGAVKFSGFYLDQQVFEPWFSVEAQLSAGN